MDVTNELDEEFINRFQSIIGVISWSIELGKIDIITGVSCFSRHLCSPREGRLNDVYKVFRYLQNNISNNLGRIAFDPAFEHKYEKVFWGSTIDLEGWNDFYPDAAEAHICVQKLDQMLSFLDYLIYYFVGI